MPIWERIRKQHYACAKKSIHPSVHFQSELKCGAWERVTPSFSQGPTATHSCELPTPPPETETKERVWAEAHNFALAATQKGRKRIVVTETETETSTETVAGQQTLTDSRMEFSHMWVHVIRIHRWKHAHRGIKYVQHRWQLTHQMGIRNREEW